MKKRVYLVLTLYVIFATIIAWLMFRQMALTRNSLVKNQFFNQTESFLFSLKERYERNRVVLDGLDGFFKASDFITFDEWKPYVLNLKLPEKFPGITWIAFIKNLPESDKSNFVQSIKDKQIKDFKIWPESNDPFYYPIVYISPKYFEDLIGYDFNTMKAQSEALKKSINSRSLSTSSFIDVTSTKSVKSERILFEPIIKGDNKEIFGWVAASIDFATIIEQTEKGVFTSDIDIDVYAGDQPTLENLVFQKRTATLKESSLSTTKIFDFAGTTWTFIFKSTADVSSNVSAYGVLLFLFLVLIISSFGLFLYFKYLKKSGVVNFDSELEKWILSSTQYAVIATDLNGLIIYFNSAAEKLLGYRSGEVIDKKTPVIFHDSEEITLRAEELSSILKKEIKPGFEVFVALAEKDIPECRRWTYIRKDQSRVSVQLSASTIKKYNKEPIGYVGFTIEVDKIKF